MTLRAYDTIAAMLDMLTFFEERCADKDTLQRLVALANDRSRWKEAHALFTVIRLKNLAAGKRKDELALAQYGFEEVCAKTLCNVGHEPAPFDPDSPFWILPLALELGKKLGVKNAGEISPLLEM